MTVPVVSPRTEALLTHLRFTKSGINEILGQLLEIDDGLDEAAKIVSIRPDRRDYILPQYLAELVTRTGSKSLYEKIK